MQMEIFVVDTHALAWFLARDQRLSARARQILQKAEAGQVQVLVPMLVLAELPYISNKRRTPITIDTTLAAINQGDGFTIADFDFSVFQSFLALPQDWELHDRIIAATAKRYSAQLITRDEVLQNSADLETIWN